MKKVSFLSLLLLSFAGASTSFAQTRDPLKWPFSKYSIWNVPIHNNASYVAAGIQDAPNFAVDEDVIILKPSATTLNVETNYADWSGGDRCPDQGPTLFSAPIPSDWIYDNTVWEGSTPNSGAAILRTDGKIVQTQPFAKCNTNFATSHYVWSADACVLTGECIIGAHGGSGLSTIGGTIRMGEFTAGEIKHALKINLFGRENFYHDSNGGYRWPANKEDGGYNDANAANYYGGTNPQMKIGALLAIHKNVTLSGLGSANSLGLETEAGLIIARALQNYGGYTVDNTAWDSYAFVVENGPDGRVRDEFESKYGFGMGVYGSLDNSAWGRDLKRIFTNLYVISNNAEGNIGGGPTTDTNRRAAFAPDFASASNPVLNFSFESGGATQTPANWSEWNNVSTAYTEIGGGSQEGTYHLTHWSASAYEVSNYQTVTGLSNGTYTLSAWVMSSGGQPTCQVIARGFGGSDKIGNVPTATSAWTQVSIPGIVVTNGKCEIHLYSKANANNWAVFDNISLTKTSNARVGEKTDESPETLLQAYPVPAVSELKVVYQSTARQRATIQLVDVLSQVKLSQSEQAQAGRNQASLRVGQLENGLYLLQIQLSTQKLTRKVLIQR